MVFGGFEYSGGELEVADVADDLVDLGLGDAGDGEHVAELPVVLADAAEDGKTKGGVGVVAGVVDAVDEGGALVGADGGGAVALGAVGVEDCFALAGCLRQVRWASDGLGCGFVGCVRSRGFAAGGEGEQCGDNKKEGRHGGGVASLPRCPGRGSTGRLPGRRKATRCHLAYMSTMGMATRTLPPAEEWRAPSRTSMT